MRLTSLFVLGFLGAAFVACIGDSPTGGNPTDGGGTCTPGALTCVGAEIHSCNPQGTGVLPAAVETCASAALCAAGVSSGKCAAPACGPQDFSCSGNDRVACKADRTGFETTKTETCSGATPVCDAGKCVACKTGAFACAGKVPQQCVANAWQLGSACGGQAASSCVGGDCLDTRIARWRMPNDPSSTVNPAKFSSPSAGIVHDDVTGLDWQAAVSPPTLAVGMAGYCETLNVDGVGGWHLPSMVELLSIVDYSRATNTSGSIFPSAFPGNHSGVAAATIGASDRLELDAAQQLVGTTASENVTGNSYVLRCARSSQRLPTGPRYTEAVTGEVTDNYTKLVWQKTNAATLSNYSGAPGKCPTPWRLPTIKELFTLLDPTASAAPYVDQGMFPSTKDLYWSQTTQANGNKFVVDFFSGKIAGNSLTNAVAVRCVK